MTTPAPLTDDERDLAQAMKAVGLELEKVKRMARTVDADAHRDLIYALNLIESRLGMYGRRDMLYRIAAAKGDSNE